MLADSGCIAVSGGLEVASDRLLNLMQKGVTVAQVARVTKAFSDAGRRMAARVASRMEAKDGSFGFDFAGEYTRVVPHDVIEYTFGGRVGLVEFTQGPPCVTVRVTFDAEATHSEEQQRAGWQAILDNFARHVTAARTTR